MDIAINTDFHGSQCCAEPKLRLIAEANFTHLHWCHEWNSDFLYSKYEIAEIAKWLKKYNLKLLDIHGSTGREKLWFSPEEYRRKSGVELVLNRIRMFAELEGQGGVIMHIPKITTAMTPEARTMAKTQYAALKRSLDELMPELEKNNVLIAVENTFSDSFEFIYDLMENYPAEYLGITYDSGHGNIAEAKGLDLLEKVKDRIQVLHLNDNDHSGDQHQPPFYGNIDWDRMLDILNRSSYAQTDRPLSFELATYSTPFKTEESDPEKLDAILREFLKDAYARCEKIAKKYETMKKQN